MGRGARAITESVRNLSELQQEVLSDAFVTAGEADRVAAAVVDCAASQGTEVIPSWTDDGLVFTTSGGKTIESSDVAIAVFDSCYAAKFFTRGFGTGHSEFANDRPARTTKPVGVGLSGLERVRRS